MRGRRTSRAVALAYVLTSSGSSPPSFERHIAVCSSCVAYLRTYEETIRLARGSLVAMSEVPPPELVDAILAAMKK